MDVIKKRGLIIKNLMCMCAGWVGVCGLGWCVGWVGVWVFSQFDTVRVCLPACVCVCVSERERS